MRNKSSAPHLIVYNCKIYDPSQRDFFKHTALAVADEGIIAVGNDRDILNLSHSSCRQINAQNQWLLPALIDSHTHLTSYVARKLQIDLSDCNTLDEALAKVKAKVEDSEPGSWIIGAGWDKIKWGLTDYPDKRLLDEISNQHFISLQSKDWHSLWVNSPVLRLCDITELRSDPGGGRIYRFPNSDEPTGILQEKACEIVFQSIAPLTLEQIYPALKETFQEFHQYGITGIHSVETPYDFSHYNRLYEANKLRLRVFWYFPDQYLGGDTEVDYSNHRGNSFLKICGVKMFADGSLGSQTAEMLEAYEGLDHTGVAVLSPDELQEKIHLSVEEKLPCAIHAIGDLANRKVLKAFGDVHTASAALDLRHRIEHAQLLHPQDFQLFAKNRVIASVQPIHLAADIPIVEKYWGNRGRYAYAFRSLWESGAKLIFGSDTPVESFDPWKSIYTAVARRYNWDPNEPSFYPEEQLNIQQALQAYTLNSAYAAYEEKQLGTIEPGKLADFILIDQDIFNQPAEALLNTKVVLTVQAGRVVYETEL